MVTLTVTDNNKKQTSDKRVNNTWTSAVTGGSTLAKLIQETKAYLYVAPSHKSSLNSRLADQCYQLNNSCWGSIWMVFTLLQKCILETFLSYDVVVIFCLINEIKVLQPLLRKMCKSTTQYKNVQAIFSKWPPPALPTLSGYNLYHCWPTTFIYNIYHFKQQTLRFPNKIYASKYTQNGS